MPLYSFKCKPPCSKVKDVLLTVSEMEKPTKESKKETKCECGKQMEVYYSSAPGIRTETKNRV